MKRIFATAALAALFAAPAGAAWWAENDYSFGSNGLTKESLTLFDNATGRFTAGANAGFYKDSASYKDKVFSFRAPLMYSGKSYFISLKPFLYPVNPGTRSGAGGGKLYYMSSLSESDDESYLHLILSGAWARQKAFASDGLSADQTYFSQGAAEVQVDKSFYDQFFFLASAAGFGKPSGGLDPRAVVKPVLDQSELAYLGTFRPATALPEWAMTVQAARNMKPDFDSHIYAGYSKISFRRGAMANSAIMGMKLGLNEKSTLDVAYNAYKEEGAAWKNYYKLLLQLFF